MYKNATNKALWLNADRTKIVQEGHPEAATLLVGATGALTDDEAQRYGLVGTKVVEYVKVVTPLEEAKAGLERALARGSVEEARVWRQHVVDREAEAAHVAALATHAGTGIEIAVPAAGSRRTT